MKRRDVIRTVGATATLGIVAGTAAAKPPCDEYCVQMDCADCADWCGDVCGGCLCP